MRDEGSAPQPQDAQKGNTFAPVGEAPYGNNYGRPGARTLLQFVHIIKDVGLSLAPLVSVPLPDNQ